MQEHSFAVWRVHMQQSLELSVIFQLHGGFISVSSSSFPKRKNILFVLGRAFTIFDGVTVINRSHLNSRWQKNLNWTPCGKVKLPGRVLCNSRELLSPLLQFVFHCSCVIPSVKDKQSCRKSVTEFFDCF